jgi:hypothetical protein
MRVPRLLLYPLLAAAYPVLALAAGNPGEIPGLWVLTWPLAISLFVSFSAWLLLSVFIRDPDRRAFLTLMVGLLFAFYGYFTLGLREVAWAAPYAHTVLPFLFIVAYLAGATYLVFRLVPNLRGLTRFLSIFTAILLGWSSVDLVRQTTRWTDSAAESHQPHHTQTSSTANGMGGPDIYLIVLDKYTGGRSLRNNFGFDNSDFETFLVKRGFVLPRAPQANYIYTALSLASLLNYRYFQRNRARKAAPRFTSTIWSKTTQSGDFYRHATTDSSSFRLASRLPGVTGSPICKCRIRARSRANSRLSGGERHWRAPYSHGSASGSPALMQPRHSPPNRSFWSGSLIS